MLRQTEGSGGRSPQGMISIFKSEHLVKRSPYATASNSFVAYPYEKFYRILCKHTFALFQGYENALHKNINDNTSVLCNTLYPFGLYCICFY